MSQFKKVIVFIMDRVPTVNQFRNVVVSITGEGSYRGSGRKDNDRNNWGVFQQWVSSER